MKKIFKKSNIFAFVFGIITTTSIGVVAANLSATTISFEPSDTTWKKTDGTNIQTVKEAIDELYKEKTTFSFNQLYYLGPSSPQDFSYTFTETTKNVLVIISTIRDVSINESDYTISLPNNAVEVYDLTTGESFNGRTGHAHASVYYIPTASGTISGRISYRGAVKIVQMN